MKKEKLVRANELESLIRNTKDELEFFNQIEAGELEISSVCIKSIKHASQICKNNHRVNKESLKGYFDSSIEACSNIIRSTLEKNLKELEKEFEEL